MKMESKWYLLVLTVCCCFWSVPAIADDMQAVTDSQEAYPYEYPSFETEAPICDYEIESFCEVELDSFQRADTTKRPPQNLQELLDGWGGAHTRCNLIDRFGTMVPDLQCLLTRGTWEKRFPDTKERCYCGSKDDLRSRPYDPTTSYCENFTTVSGYLSIEHRNEILASRIIDLIYELKEFDPSNLKSAGIALKLLGYPCSTNGINDGFEEKKKGFCCRHHAGACLNCLSKIGVDIEKGGIGFGCRFGTAHIVNVFGSKKLDGSEQFCVFESQTSRIAFCLDRNTGETMEQWIARNKTAIAAQLRRLYSSFFNCEGLREWVEFRDVEEEAKIQSCCSCKKEPWATSTTIIFPNADANDPYGKVNCDKACGQYFWPAGIASPKETVACTSTTPNLR